MSEHTPTPWRVAHYNPKLVLAPEGVKWNPPVARCDTTHGLGDARDMEIANAAFIVQAVNSHAALVAALKMVRERWTFNNYQEHTHTWHDWADCKVFIDAALAGRDGK